MGLGSGRRGSWWAEGAEGKVVVLERSGEERPKAEGGEVLEGD